MDALTVGISIAWVSHFYLGPLREVWKPNLGNSMGLCFLREPGRRNGSPGRRRSRNTTDRARARELFIFPYRTAHRWLTSTTYSLCLCISPILVTIGSVLLLDKPPSLTGRLCHPCLSALTLLSEPGHYKGVFYPSPLSCETRRLSNVTSQRTFTLHTCFQPEAIINGFHYLNLHLQCYPVSPLA